jgi:hypothetical protein
MAENSELSLNSGPLLNQDLILFPLNTSNAQVPILRNSKSCESGSDGSVGN